MKDQTELKDQNTAFLDLIAAEAQTPAFRQFADLAANSPHPAAELLAEYAAGELDEHTAPLVRAHLAVCHQCARETVNFIRLADELEQASLAWAEQAEAVWVSPEATSAVPTPGPAAAAKSLGERALQWISELWEPQWAGQLLTAADVPEQTHTFTSEHGDIRLTCHWQGVSAHEPAMIRISWHTDLVQTGRLWIRFVNPANHTLRQEIFLGSRAVGEEQFTIQDLTFDFLREPWAVSMALER